MKRIGQLKKKIREKRGFTLIEMIIVIAIIAILITLIAPNLMKFLQTAKQTKVDGAAKTLYTSANAVLTELYVAGTPFTGTGWGKGSSPAVPAKAGETGGTFDDVYFNSDELKNCKSYKVHIENGVVSYVEWEDNDGLTSRYPKEGATTGGGSGGGGGGS